MPGTLRILHVDDDQSFGDLAADFLERQDERFDVHSVSSARVALDRIEVDPPDCVVSDYAMREMDGIELLEAVRESYPDLPFVLFTGKGSEAVASEAIRAGATDYLQKESGTEQYELLANRIRNAVDQRRSASALAQERSRTAFALETADAVIWTRNVETDAMETRPTDPSVFDTRIDSLPTLLAQVHPDDREAVEAAVRSAAEAGDPFSVDFRFDRDGEGRWGELAGRAPGAEPGRERQSGVVRDVTGPKRAERRFESMFDDPNILVGLLETDGTMISVNETALEYVEADAADLAGQAFWDTPWWTPEAVDDLREWIDRAAGGEYVEYAATHPRSSGDEFIVEGSIRPVTDSSGAVVSLIVSGRDVTDRKQREAELERVRNRMEFALERTSSVICERDPETGAVETYPDPSPILGGSIETRAEFQTRVSAADLPGVAAAFDDTAADGESRTVEFRTSAGVDQDWVETRIRPVSEGGEVDRIVDVSRDITAQKRRESQLEAQNAQFDQLASVVSHDLQAPIDAVRGWLELVVDTGDVTKAESALSALDRVDDLREDLVDTLRAREVVGDLERIGVADRATAAWDRVDSPAGSTLHRVDSPTMNGDPEATTRLLQNLLSNAVEHGDGEVTVHVGALENGFYVEDDGPGIDPANHDAVFTPGFTTKDSGSGMGMASVRQIVDGHGWQIAIEESEALDGVRFEISV